MDVYIQKVPEMMKQFRFGLFTFTILKQKVIPKKLSIKHCTTNVAASNHYYREHTGVLIIMHIPSFSKYNVKQQTYDSEDDPQKRQGVNHQCQWQNHFMQHCLWFTIWWNSVCNDVIILLCLYSCLNSARIDVPINMTEVW